MMTGCTKPNLLKVAVELASYGDASRPVADALLQLLAAHAGTKPPAPEGRSNNEKFNAILNNCENPRAVYNALLALSKNDGGIYGGQNNS